MDTYVSHLVKLTILLLGTDTKSRVFLKLVQ